VRSFALLCIIAFFNYPLIAQAPRAILADGSGPWRDDRWIATVAELGRLLNDAGYSIETVSPVDLPTTLGASNLLLALPSLESLPFDTFTAVVNHLNRGGMLMATGGVPFRDALYLAPNGAWLDSAAYQQLTGSLPLQGLFRAPAYETLCPSTKQYTNRSGLRVPFPRSPGLTSVTDEQGRYSALGDPLSPAATFYKGSLIPYLIVWLPSPQLSDPLRSQFVAALRAAGNQLYFLNAGPNQITWLPGEHISGAGAIANASLTPVKAVLQWSIVSASSAIAQPPVQVSLPSGGHVSVPFDVGVLPNGDYTLRARLMISDEEVDRIDSPIRVLDPLLTRQPDQKIHVVNGAFYAGNQRVFLQGVNYWPRYVAGMEQYRFNGRSWLAPDQYDPNVIEADLSEIAALHFNLVSIQYEDLLGDTPVLGRALIDFLERCREHGLWARIAIRATSVNAAYSGMLLPGLGAVLEYGYLPGNDRVFSYELLWEPMVGSHDHGGQGGFVNGVYTVNLGRTLLDPDWRSWVNDQYGSLANAQQAWGITGPQDAKGQLTNPLDEHIENDGPWRIMVAAYRRFLDDYLGRNLGLIAREIRRTDPDTLLSYRNWATMTEVHNSQTGYDLGTAAAHLDFFSPENYQAFVWPDDRKWGFVTAYSRYRTGGKPVQWTEFGFNVGSNDGTSDTLASETATCDTMMRLINDDGSNAASVWWWPGGPAPVDQSDFGIVDPDGTPRGCALTLSQWSATFASSPPDLGSGSVVTLSVDRDADARGQYGLFLNLQSSYAQARSGGQRVFLSDQGTNSDTATAPLIQVGNVPYVGSGPMKYANAEFGGVRIVCPNLDVTVENNSQVQILPGAACQITLTIVNTGEAAWLPASASQSGVLLHTNLGDLPLGVSAAALARVSIGPLEFTMSQNSVNLVGRMRIESVGDFGEVLRLTLAVDSSATGSCAIGLSPSSAISIPAAGLNGTVNVMAGAGCSWSATSPLPWVTLSPAASAGTGQVVYTIPANIGPARQTTITIAGHPLTVSQAAAATAPTVQAPVLSAANLGFGGQTIGVASSARTVTLTNSGIAAFSLATIGIGGLNNSDFSQTNTCGATLSVAASCSIGVVFTPAAAGLRTASVFISGNANGGPLVVNLSGQGMGTGATPIIQSIVDSWNYTPGVAPGLWVTISGANLAGFSQAANFATVELPESLGGVVVTFNGAPAVLSYVSPTQVNALVPASLFPGSVQIVVQSNGVSSDPFPIVARGVQPAIYALPNADASMFYVTAALAGTATLVGNSTIDPRVTRPILPGDTLDLYMIGLGATSDPSKFVTDKVFSGAFPVTAAIATTVGGESAPVSFAGLTSPGLYLVRITVPNDLKPGTQPFQLLTGNNSMGGAATRPSLELLIGPPALN
jgi:uncharacterized protein (TIGR03437 family)